MFRSDNKEVKIAEASKLLDREVKVELKNDKIVIEEKKE